MFLCKRGCGRLYTFGGFSADGLGDIITSNDDASIARSRRSRAWGVGKTTTPFRVAQTQNVAPAALETENSPPIDLPNLTARGVRSAEAKAWLGIAPASTKGLREQAERERQAKIVAFPGQAAPFQPGGCSDG